MRIKKSLTALFVLCLCFTAPLCALESHVLENGLEVFLEENHIVPLVTIRITFRAGAIVETMDLNGLCHLYEHMLFKGNALYKNQEQFKAALKRMGAGNWNGGTSTEFVTYYITIPSDKLAEGLEFWAYAVKAPLLDGRELVKERQVVHNEIAGNQSEPHYMLMKAEQKALYPDYWFRRDVGGDLGVIDTASVEKMEYIKNNFYVPNNAALFISGDIYPEAVLPVIKKYYGDWQKGKGFPEIPPHRPLKKDVWVAVNNSPTKGLVDVKFSFRGPDAGVDPGATYGADVWGQVMNDPAGTFKNAVYKKVPELHGGTRFISAGYYTQRDAGLSFFSFKLRVPEEKGLLGIIERLRQAVTDEIARMVTRQYFTREELSSAKQELRNHDILSRETSDRYLANLSFWWASTSTDYYLSYLDRIEAVSGEAVRGYVKGYLVNRPFLTSVWINIDDDAKHGIVKTIGETKQ